MPESTTGASRVDGVPLFGPCFMKRVFRRRNQAEPMEVNVLAKAVRRNESFGLDHFTPHDLRRTAASGMASEGLPRFTVRRVLGHADAEITATYDLYSYDKEKKAAMERWSKVLIDRLRKARLQVVK